MKKVGRSYQKTSGYDLLFTITKGAPVLCAELDDDGYFQPIITVSCQANGP